MRIPILILLFFLSGKGWAQEFSFKTYTTKDGLSSNTITYVFKDSQGFLWCCTPNGLNRFDGNAFDVYNNNPKDNRTIASNDVQTVFEDSRKQLWIGTLSGISLYHPQTQNFSNYSPDTTVCKPGRNYNAIIEDRHRRLWLATAYELLVFDPVAKKFSGTGWADFIKAYIPEAERTTRVLILGFAKKNNDELWVLTTYGLCSVVTSTNQFTFYPYSGVPDYFGCQLNYYDEAAGIIWLGSYNHGIVRFDYKKNEWKKIPTPLKFLTKKDFDWAYCIKPFNGDTLMYCTQNGMMLFNKTAQQHISMYSNVQGNENSFPKTTANYFLKDGSSFWICSSIGLYLMQPVRNKFLFTNLMDGHPDDFVRNIHVSAYNGLVIAGHDNLNRVYVYNEKNGVRLPLTTPGGQQLKAYVDRVTEAPDGISYLSSDNGVFLLNQQNLTATEIKLQLPANISGDALYRNVVVDDSGMAWVRTRMHGIIKYNPFTKTSTPLAAIPAREGRAFRFLFYNQKENSLWVSMEDEGLYIYDLSTGKVHHEWLFVPPSQNAATITSMVADKKGNVYLADYTQGLYKYLADEKKFIRFSRQDGMSANGVNDLNIDDDGNIWMATNEGISRLSTATGIFTNYGPADGVPLFTDNIRRGKDGYMYCRYNTGFYKWNIRDFDAGQQQGNIYIRNARLFDENLAIDTLYELAHNQNTLMFQFGLLTAATGNTPLLEYSINNAPFAKFSGANVIQFSNLAAGNYRMVVRQKNVPLNQYVINIKIKNPYWKTWWFITMLALAAVYLLYFFTRKRIGAVQKEAAYRQRIAETEMAALRAQMNPHFIFNCLSSIDNFIQDNNADKASDYLNKFAKLIRAILDNSRNEVVPFWKDWETLQLYLELEHLRSDHTFEYSLDADENLLNGHYKIPPLIIQPYVENAIHHGLKNRKGRGGLIKITAKLKNELLEYTIEDNGVGRNAAKALKELNRPAHTSYGMQISLERIRHFNTGAGNIKDLLVEDLQDENGNPSGTRVIVLLTV